MHALISFLLLAMSSAMDIPIGHHWDGGFRSEFCYPITKEVNHWTAHLLLDHSLDKLDIWVADIAQTLQGGKEFVLTSKQSDGEQKVGDKLCVRLVGHLKGDVVPKAQFYIEGMEGHAISQTSGGDHSHVSGNVLYQLKEFHTGDYKQGLPLLKHGAFDEGSGSVVNDPAGSGQHVLRVYYEKGHYVKIRGNRGLQFYWTPINAQTTLTLSYDIYFDPHFDFVKGGKLPGLWGGSQTCSGGRHYEDCFSTRFMWRSGGGGELYAYIPPNQAHGFCDHNTCNFDYGNSLGRDSWKFKKGEWQNVAQQIHLNTPGKQDGYAKVWYNGKLVYHIENVVFRTKASVTIDGIFFSTFFGGSSADWAPTRDSYTYFRNFVLSKDSAPHILG